MHILLLAPYACYPPRGGGAERIYQLVRGLATQHELTVLSFASDEATVSAMAPLQLLCTLQTVPGPQPRSLVQRARSTLFSRLPDMALRNADSGYARALKQLLASQSFDVLLAESIEMARYLPAMRQALRRQPRPLQVLDEFNAEYLLQRRAALTDLRRLRRWPAGFYSCIQWFKLARYERKLLQRCDLTIAVSDDDRQALLRLQPAAPISVVPNGVDTSFFTPLPDIRRESQTILFSGTLDFRPNIDAIRWFVEQVLPRIRALRPRARLLLVGRRPASVLHALAASSQGAIELIGEVPDTRPYFARASVYVVPMRIGGGIRLKVLEALAMQVPLVSTSMGAEGITGLRGGEHCLLADTPAQFASAVVRLLDDNRLGQQLGLAGREFVRQFYDWERLVPRLEQALGALQRITH